MRSARGRGRGVCPSRLRTARPPPVALRHGKSRSRWPRTPNAPHALSTPLPMQPCAPLLSLHPPRPPSHRHTHAAWRCRRSAPVGWVWAATRLCVLGPSLCHSTSIPLPPALSRAPPFRPHLAAPHSGPQARRAPADAHAHSTPCARGAAADAQKELPYAPPHHAQAPRAQRGTRRAPSPPRDHEAALRRRSQPHATRPHSGGGDRNLTPRDRTQAAAAIATSRHETALKRRQSPPRPRPAPPLRSPRVPPSPTWGRPS